MLVTASVPRPAPAVVCRMPQGDCPICTLLYLPWSRGPYLAAIGLNRDEQYGRPSAPPCWWSPSRGGDGFFAPRDLEAGGTWFGLGEQGLFAAITNGHQPGPFRHDRSRGELVVDALRAGHFDRAVSILTARDAYAYASCYLLLAQHGTTAYLTIDRDGSFRSAMDRGHAHTLRNSGLDAHDVPWAGATRRGRGTARDLRTLRSALISHESPSPLCRHGAEAGTRSCAIVLLAATLKASRLFYADGRPCETPMTRIRFDVG